MEKSTVESKDRNITNNWDTDVRDIPANNIELIPAKKTINVEVTLEMYATLQKIQEWYRSNSISHTIRLMIEDVGKGIEAGGIESRFRTNIIKGNNK